MTLLTAIARVNGVPLHDDGETLDDASLRQRASTELLRQAAERAGIQADSTGDAIELPPDDLPGAS